MHRSREEWTAAAPSRAGRYTVGNPCHRTIIAGNKTVEEAKRLDLPVRVVKTRGDVLIAVQREDLDLTTDSRAHRLAIADNGVGQLDLVWDVETLKRQQAEGLDLSPFWTPEEFTTLVAEPAKGLTDEKCSATAR